MNTALGMQPVKKTSHIEIMRNIGKGAGLLALYLGVLSSQGIIQSLIPFHIIAGVILGTLIFMLSFQAAQAGVLNWVVAFALVWSIGMGLSGIFHDFILPNHQTLAQVLHVVSGIGAIGISEMLAATTQNLRAKRTNK